MNQATGNHRQQLSLYRKQQVAAATPAELLLFLYDIAVASCAAQDKERAVSCFSEMIDSLNFEQNEIASGLFRLHEYCLEQVQSGNFAEAHRIVKELRDAWRAALREQSARTAAA